MTHRCDISRIILLNLSRDTTVLYQEVTTYIYQEEYYWILSGDTTELYQEVTTAIYQEEYNWILTKSKGNIFINFLNNMNREGRQENRDFWQQWVKLNSEENLNLQFIKINASWSKVTSWFSFHSVSIINFCQFCILIQSDHAVLGETSFYFMWNITK